MAAKIISGTEVAKQIREELAKEVSALKEKHNVVPGLVTILVGENPASVSYVTGKQKTAKELGFYSIQDNQPDDISEAKLLELIEQYNKDPKIHGILVQLPLPKHINETKVLYAIDPQEGRGRLPSGERGQTDDRRGRLSPLHPGRNPATPHPLGGEDRRSRSGGPGAVEHRGQTHRQHPAPETKGGQRHRDHLPHGHEGYCLPYPTGGHPHRGRRASPRP